MAYGVYFRRAGSKRNYARVVEWVVPTRQCKMTYDGKILRDQRFETIEEAEATAEEYRRNGYETKFKEVK